MAKIKEVSAREILDSRGNPTIEVCVALSNGLSARSSAPAGVSKGTYEAVELRDQDDKRFNGMGVLNAVKIVNEVIGPAIAGMEVLNLQKIDNAMIELDGTMNKSKLGGNSTVAVSQACAKLGAKNSGIPLFLYLRQYVESGYGRKIPVPVFNLIEGGRHANASLNFQEFLLIPASSKDYSESLRIGTEVYHVLKKNLFDKNESVLMADEGGFSPELPTNQSGISAIRESVEAAGYSYAYDCFMGIDFAANSFTDGKTYKISDKASSFDNSAELVEFYKTLVTDNSLIYLEDPFAENDWEGWKKLATELASKTLIVGDDLVTTNPYRLQDALSNQVIGGIIIKPNQIGTVSEAIAVAEIARFKKLKLVVSHRAGETDDDFIADFAVGIGADYAKFGAPARERVIKYNRLLEIEKELEKI